MKADIGIIGGSGLYSMATGLEEIEVNTEYGDDVGAGVRNEKAFWHPSHYPCKRE